MHSSTSICIAAAALLACPGCELYATPDRSTAVDGGDEPSPDAPPAGHPDAAGQVDATGHAGVRVIVILGYDAAQEAWMVQGALEADARIDEVDTWVIGPDNPSLPGQSQLAGYDLLVYGWNDEAIIDTDARVLLGNWLADYVDAGGGLLTLGYAQGRSALLGRILTAGYLPLRPPAAAPYTLTTPAAMVVAAPDHDLIDGVDALTSSARAITVVDPDATLLGSWDDQQPLAAIKGPVVSFGFHLDPTDIYLAGDWQRLLANAAAASGD